MLFPPLFAGSGAAGFFTARGGSIDDIITRLKLVPGNIYLPIQKHTGKVAIVGEDMSPEVADAALTDRSGILLGVLTADCVPILLFDNRRKVVGAVHAGWRGTAAGILKNAVAAMSESFASSPGDLLVAVGPAIGECCYEVGPEVIEGVSKATGSGDYVSEKAHGSHINLPEANRLQALSMGVPAGNIWLAGECTFCNPDKYYSYRYDKGITGRQYAVIGITSRRIAG